MMRRGFRIHRGFVGLDFQQRSTERDRSSHLHQPAHDADFVRCRGKVWHSDFNVHTEASCATMSVKLF
jgi:hypothetical protein